MIGAVQVQARGRVKDAENRIGLWRVSVHAD
jgi:hypothetical protein